MAGDGGSETRAALSGARLRRGVFRSGVGAISRMSPAASAPRVRVRAIGRWTRGRHATSAGTPARRGVLRLSIGSYHGGWWTARENRGTHWMANRAGAWKGRGGGRSRSGRERGARGGGGGQAGWTVGALMNQFKCMR